MHVRNTFWAALPVFALIGLATACSDVSTTGPLAPAGTSLSKTSTGNSNSYTVSQTTVGDTVVTTFVVGTNSLTAATFNIGYHGKIDFPYSASSICDPAQSTYGPTEWDKSCTALTASIQITAKHWITQTGYPATDFQPALRFVPGLRKPVTLYLKDSNGAGWGPRIDFCSPSGCVNEALSDPSVATQYDSTNGWYYRTIKHFSGYTLAAD